MPMLRTRARRYSKEIKETGGSVLLHAVVCWDGEAIGCTRRGGDGSYPDMSAISGPLGISAIVYPSVPVMIPAASVCHKSTSLMA